MSLLICCRWRCRLLVNDGAREPRFERGSSRLGLNEPRLNSSRAQFIVEEELDGFLCFRQRKHLFGGGLASTARHCHAPIAILYPAFPEPSSSPRLPLPSRTARHRSSSLAVNGSWRRQWWTTADFFDSSEGGWRIALGGVGEEARVL
nr:unnamed protein product [Digitaria exilis]